MYPMKRQTLIALSLLLMLSLTGCWGNKEIEEQTILVGLGMDVAQRSSEEEQLAESGSIYPRKELVTLTFQIIPFQKRQVSSKSDKSSSDLYSNIQETGDSIFQMIRQMANRRSKPMMGHHVKVIVISEELARKIEIDKLLKFVLRDNAIRPSCIVLMSKGKASQVLVSNNSGEIPSLELVGLVENQGKSNNILPSKNLTKLDGIINSGSSFTLQNLASSVDEVAVAGASIIKGKTRKLVGSLSEWEVQALSWIQGSVKGGVLKTIDQGGQTITYEVISEKTKIKSKVEGDKISFEVNVKTIGRLIENWDTRESSENEEYIREVEKLFVRQLEDMMNDVIRKMRDTYHVDVGGFGDHFRIQHPKMWRKLEKDWDSAFTRSEVKCNVNLIIEDTGSSAK
ncbi:Ger(x)C family spore germination protein [Paenibacillus aceti]|uniref:Germination protein BC n=1 Tax=Paenibacillus aceti TaxID=1820010 RepID=A0ABQ1VUB1_9BACL|nr:Ger(x)C family spore germination protein [Paenibacillus aceti]GGF94836.1 germination protein BC [Paenibacillus aceti]